MSTTDTVPRPTRFPGAEKSCKGGRRDGMDYEMQKNKKQQKKAESELIRVSLDVCSRMTTNQFLDSYIYYFSSGRWVHFNLLD